MEDNKEILKESLKKISGLMYYDSKKTAFENEEIIVEQGFLQNARNKVGNVTSNIVGGRTGTSKWKQKTNQPVTANEITTITRVLHNSLNGRIFNSDSKDMRQAYSEIYYLQGRKYNGADAIETVKSEYQRRYGSDLVSDIETKLTNLDFKGAENQKNFLAVLNSGGGTNTQPETGQDTAQNVTSGGKTGWYPECSPGINKVGCKSGAIGQVQKLLGGLTLDNKFGPETQKKLAAVAPEFSQQFTDADVKIIRDKLIANVDPAKFAPTGKVNPSKMANPGMTPTTSDTISTQANEGGYTNMAQGFVNESTISHKEMKRINKEARLNKKLGRS